VEKKVADISGPWILGSNWDKMWLKWMDRDIWDH